MNNNSTPVFLVFIIMIVMMIIIGNHAKQTETEQQSKPSEAVTAVELPTENTRTTHETHETHETAVYTCVDIPVETSPIIPETTAQTPLETIPQYENKILDVPLDPAIQNHIKTVCDEYNVPFELVVAVIYVESGFDPSAVSAHGDYGLMQVSSINHGWLSDELGITDFLDPYQNVRAGVHILAQKIRESDGEFTTALMKYNRGDAVALEQMANGIFSTDYTDKVLTKYYEYIREG